jgi:hypothetical protein
MANPKRLVRPEEGNRARMMTVGTMPEPEKFSIENLEATVVEANAPPYVVEGNPTLEAPDNAAATQTPEQTAPEGQAPEQKPAVAPAPEPDDVDDERFKGKSKKDIFDAFRNLEKKFGEHSVEVATYRKLYEEQVLKPQVEAKMKAEQAPVEQVNPADDTALLNEMLSSPSKFAKRQREEAQREMMQSLMAQAQSATIAAEKAKVQDVISSPEFVSWLVATVPKHVAEQADRDPATLNFILNSYKATAPDKFKQEDAPAQAEVQIPVKGADRRIPVGNAVGVPAASRQPASAQFTLSQLADMQLRRPDEYARRQPEIIAWYLEQQSKKK